jgi:hypothetical protein
MLFVSYEVLRISVCLQNSITLISYADRLNDAVVLTLIDCKLLYDTNYNLLH